MEMTVTEIDIVGKNLSVTRKKDSELSISRGGIMYVEEEPIKYRTILLKNTYNYNKRTNFFNITSKEHDYNSAWRQYISTNYVRVYENKSNSNSNTAPDDINSCIFQLSDIIYKKLFKKI